MHCDQKVHAIILDWAGTAVDHGCMGPVAVFVEVFKKRGVDVTMDEARAPMGLQKKDHVRAMCAMEGVAARWQAAHGSAPTEADVDAMYLDTEPMMVACTKDHAQMIPGVVDTIAALRERGLKVGSTTGYTAPMMEELVPRAKAQGYEPDAIVCPDDAPAGRPAPWMCFEAAKCLGVYPMHAIIKIGDTVSDIDEGRNAGMWTIGLTRTGNELGMPAAEVDALPQAERQARLAAVGHKLQMAGAHALLESLGETAKVLAAIDIINARLARGERP